MKKYLLAVLLLAGLKAGAQDFNPQKQSLYIRTDTMDALSWLQKYTKYKDSSASSIPYMPYMLWDINSSRIYCTIENQKSKKIGDVINVVIKDIYQLNVIEYKFTLKNKEVNIYYDKGKSEWSMISVEKIEGEHSKVYTLRKAVVIDK